MNASIPNIHAMRALPPAQRPCIHHLKGRIRFRPCTNDYICGTCEFDQFFYDEYSVHAVVTPVKISEIRGVKIPQGYYLHKGHAWARVEEGASIRIGMDDFALRLLGPPDRVDAPLIGKVVKQGEPHIALYRGENRASLLSPLSGVITAVNPKLREGGIAAHQDPYTEGWVMTLHPQDLRREIKDLMVARQSLEFLRREVDRLHDILEEVLPLAADGGNLVKDLFGALPQLGWERLVRSFLRS
jgi:glycine cleavage system H lipoate-binding protein